MKIIKYHHTGIQRGTISVGRLGKCLKPCVPLPQDLERGGKAAKSKYLRKKGYTE